MDTELDIHQIQALLPHRYPFLLIDRILEYESGVRALALKNVTINEPFFQGHFPGRPIMPGVLIIEAMAQLGGALLAKTEIAQNKLALLAGVDGIRLRRQVVPGDQLIIEAELVKMHRNIGKIKASARVDQATVTDGEFLFGLVDESP